MNCLGRLTAGVLTLVVAIGAVGAERTETFDLDPRWDAHNCRVATAAGREVRQDFGFSGATAHCAAKGEIGGFIQPAAEPAYYAKIISPRTPDDTRSEKRRVGEEGRSRWAPYPLKKKKNRPIDIKYFSIKCRGDSESVLVRN